MAVGSEERIGFQISRLQGKVRKTNFSENPEKNESVKRNPQLEFHAFTDHLLSYKFLIKVAYDKVNFQSYLVFL